MPAVPNLHHSCGLRDCGPTSCAGVLEWLKRMLFRVGEDWYFLTALGVLMALISYAMNFVVERMLLGNSPGHPHALYPGLGDLHMSWGCRMGHQVHQG